MRTRIFLLALSLLGTCPSGKALTFLYFGSAHQNNSLTGCNLISEAALLTNGQSSGQIGFARLKDAAPILNGADLHLCFYFGKQGGNGITLIIQQDASPDASMNGGSLDPSWVNYLDKLSAAYFAIKIETFDNVPDQFTIVTKGGVNKTFGPYPVLDASGQPFDLDQGGALPGRFFFNPANQRVQFYLNDVLLFSQAIDLLEGVFGGTPEAFVAVAATSVSPDSQAVRMAAPDYSLCRPGIPCNEKENFHNWIQDGPNTRAKWLVHSTNEELFIQQSEGLSLYRSECQAWINARFTFKVTMPGTPEGGWMVVLGGQDLDIQRGDDLNGYALICWQGSPTFTDPQNPMRVYTAHPGIALVRMHGPIPDHYGPDGATSCFVGLNPSPSFEIWSPVKSIPGQTNVSSVVLEYTTDSIRVAVNGTTYFRLAAPVGQPFHPGYVGFGGFAQKGVTFSELNYQFFDTALVPAMACEHVPTEIKLLNSISNDPVHLSKVVITYDGTTMETLSGAGLAKRQFEKEFDGQQSNPLPVEVRFYTTSGCFISQDYSTIVLSNPPVTLPPDPPPLCPGDALYIDLKGAYNPAASILWNTGATTPYLVLAQPGLYWVETVTGDSSHRCRYRDFISLQYHPASSIKATAVPDCEGQQSGELSLITLGGTPPFSYSMGPITTTVPLFSDLLPGHYTVTVTDGVGCSSTVQAVVEQIARPTLPFQIKNAPCFGDSKGAIFIQSNLGNTLFSLDGFSFRDQKVWAGLAAGHYRLYEQTSDGCTFTDTFSILEPPPITTTIQAEKAILIGDSLLLEAQVQANFLPLTWMWQGPALDTFGGSRVTARPDQDAVYRVTVTDATGCTSTSMHAVFVLHDGLAFMPNIFKPVDYGPNSRVFLWTAAGSVRRIKIWQIFNRGGDLVFERENFQPDDPAAGWDGLYRGRPVQAGVYAYRLSAELSDGKDYVIKGSITVIR